MSRQRLMIGLGLDGQDGHTRITKGDNFHIVGGSQATHERMQEHAIRVNETPVGHDHRYHGEPGRGIHLGCPVRRNQRIFGVLRPVRLVGLFRHLRLL